MTANKVATECLFCTVCIYIVIQCWCVCVRVCVWCVAVNPKGLTNWAQHILPPCTTTYQTWPASQGQKSKMTEQPAPGKRVTGFKGVFNCSSNYNILCVCVLVCVFSILTEQALHHLRGQQHTYIHILCNTCRGLHGLELFLSFFVLGDPNQTKL